MENRGEKKKKGKLSVTMYSVTFPFFLCNQTDVLNSHFVYIFFSYSCRAHDLELVINKRENTTEEIRMI